MKIMPRRNDGDSVNNKSDWLVVYQITSIPEWRNSHIKETKFTFLYIIYLPKIVSMKKKKEFTFVLTTDNDK